VGSEQGDDDVQQLLSRVVPWAGLRPDVRGLALVGSWARGAAQQRSDVDLILLSDTPGNYIERDDWIGDLGGTRLLRTQRWGAITERRFSLPGGTEVDMGIGSPDWASVDPVDPGTRRVVTDGMRVLVDPGGVLRRLLAACTDSR
jgi:uncharacterized protein